MTEVDTKIKFDRQAAVQFLIQRDGDVCQFPGCILPFDEGRPNMIRTLDHIYPQALCKAEGWPYELIWDYDNLQLMHKACNAKKGHHTYDEDGMLNIPEREPRSVKAERVPVCGLCESGRLLLGDEICELCGSEAQPKTFPAYLKRTSAECDHARFHCFACITGLVDRTPVTTMLIEGPPS